MPYWRTLGVVPWTFVRVLELGFFLFVAAATAAALLSVAFAGSHARGEHGSAGGTAEPWRRRDRGVRGPLGAQRAGAQRRMAEGQACTPGRVPRPGPPGRP